mgnify:FL=1
MNDLETYNVSDASDLAPTTAGTPGPDGGIVPGRCAGYVYDGAAFCPECAAEIEIDTADGETYKMDHFPAFDDEGRTITDGRGFGVGVLSGFDETDYPGDSCDVCHRRLRTNIIRYE